MEVLWAVTKLIQVNQCMPCDNPLLNVSIHNHYYPAFIWSLTAGHKRKGAWTWPDSGSCRAHGRKDSSDQDTDLKTWVLLF